MRPLFRPSLVLLVALATAVLWPAPEAGATVPNSITSPDTAGDVGEYTSLELDSFGFPVVSYYDTTLGDLKVMHCNDTDCAGANESITYPDTTADDVGLYTSLELDAAGYPVVSYHDGSNANLKLLHCNDANCSGGDESVTTPDGLVGGDNVGQYSSLVLDSSGDPVIGYYDASNKDLRVMHCNDPNCNGGDESITSHNVSPTTGSPADVGEHSSLALDFNGYPVVSYYEAFAQADLNVMHCNDPNCSGGDESYQNPAGPGTVGLSTSLVLDGGVPVISYVNATSGQLNVMRCNDPNCDDSLIPGNGPENVAVPDTSSSQGGYNSLALDLSGKPVVAYYHLSDDPRVKVLHCGNANCTANNSIVSPEPSDDIGGLWTSLSLDSTGNPVVTYHGMLNLGRDLSVLHCVDVNCAPDWDGDGCIDSREAAPKSSAQQGGGRNPKNPWDFFDTWMFNAQTSAWERDRVVSVGDIGGIVARFGTARVPPVTKPPSPAEEAALRTEALTPPVVITGYHAAYDRNGSVGPHPWNLKPPDGFISVGDIGAVVAQFGHSCA